MRNITSRSVLDSYLINITMDSEYLTRAMAHTSFYQVLYGYILFLFLIF